MYVISPLYYQSARLEKPDVTGRFYVENTDFSACYESAFYKCTARKVVVEWSGWVKEKILTGLLVIKSGM